jgi:hypothetical protein
LRALGQLLNGFDELGHVGRADIQVARASIDNQ